MLSAGQERKRAGQERAAKKKGRKRKKGHERKGQDNLPFLPCRCFCSQKRFPLAEQVLRAGLILQKLADELGPATARIRHDLVGVLSRDFGEFTLYNHSLKRHVRPVLCT